ncbi:MAG: hypothetical protein NT051_04760 [Candidatus Micrarchaeota archaeon]|nr:hypothetical protein [Candidatus Micrarchaeota archaeon]
MRAQLKNQDWFLSHPPSQPKREVGEYVRRNGILVPKIYDSFKEAKMLTEMRKVLMAPEKAILARSEHPQDYAGVSGMLESYSLPHSAITDEASIKALVREGNFVEPDVPSSRERLIHFIQEKLLIWNKNRQKEPVARKRQLGITIHPAKEYCDLLGISEDRFWEGVSFSYWEKLGGRNLTISADSAISGRYHVIVRWPAYYAIVENGEIILRSRDDVVIENSKLIMQNKEFPSDVSKAMLGAPDFYEQVRNLPRFSPNHCPIIEAQFTDGKYYFLQYLRSRDFEPAQFVLDRQPTDKEIVALLCRGSTSPEGEVHKIKCGYGYPPSISQQGQSMLQTTRISMISELSVRNQNLSIMLAQSSETSPALSLAFMVNLHPGISKLFKPRISVLVPSELLKEKEHLQEFYMKITADGRKAYLELL